MTETSFTRIGAYEGADELQATMAREGFMAARRQASAAHSAKVTEAARFLGAVMAGEEDPVFLKEAFYPKNDVLLSYIDSKYPGILGLRETMSVTDFANYLTVDVLDRMLYGYYQTAEIPVMPLVKKVQLRDFRSVKRFEINGAVTPFTKSGSPGEPPLQRALSPVAPITYSPDLYQGMMSINWRAIVNDDLGIFNDMVQRLSWSWNLTIWKAITGFFFDTNGPHTSLYNAGFKNLLTPTYSGGSLTNPPLSYQALAEAYTVLLRQLSPDGQPITFTGKLHLVCTPSYAMTAKAIKQSVQNQLSILGGSNSVAGFPQVRLNVDGALIPDYDVIVDQYIPLTVTGDATAANTAWLLVYDPASVARPAVEFGMLRGFDTPQLYQKMPNTQRAGGGVDPTMGDFLTMDSDYKAIAVFGGAHVDGRCTVGSTGKGS